MHISFSRKDVERAVSIADYYFSHELKEILDKKAAEAITQAGNFVECNTWYFSTKKIVISEYTKWPMEKVLKYCGLYCSTDPTTKYKYVVKPIASTLGMYFGSFEYLIEKNLHIAKSEIAPQFPCYQRALLTSKDKIIYLDAKKDAHLINFIRRGDYYKPLADINFAER